MLTHAAVISMLSLGATADFVRSIGFKLRVELRPSQKDLQPPVNGTWVKALISTSREGRLTASSDMPNTIFFVNATTPDPATWTTNWDAFGVQSWDLLVKPAGADDGGVVTAFLDAGHTGEAGIATSQTLPAELHGGADWMFCDTILGPGSNARKNLLKGRTEPDVHVPKNCAHVKLVPYRARLPDGAEDDMSHAVASPCYFIYYALGWELKLV
ncbi:hypothetical protein PWT90_01949 [Aphanocladium album]|nr:hypothetical protein PWT90_01949 [Aphanocladium album]